MSNIERKYAYYDEGVLPEEGEYGVTYLTLYSSSAGNIYDGWIYDPDNKIPVSVTERTFGYRHPEFSQYCWDDEVVVDLSNAQSRQESSEFAQGRLWSFNTNVSPYPIVLEDIDITGLTEEEREAKATTVLFSAIPLVDDSYIQAQIEVQCKCNLSPDNTSGEMRIEAFYIINDESDRSMRPNPVHTFTVSSVNERKTLPWVYANPALKHEDHNYIGVKLICTGGTAEIGISDAHEYGDAMITLVSAGLTGDNIFGGKPIDLEIFGLDEVTPGYELDPDDYTVLCTYDTGEIYDVTKLCEFNPVMGTEIIDPLTVLTAFYNGLSASMVITLGVIDHIELTGNEIIHGSYTFNIKDYTVFAYFNNGDVWDVTNLCAFDPVMGTTVTSDTTLTATLQPSWMPGSEFTDSLDLTTAGVARSSSSNYDLIYTLYDDQVLVITGGVSDNWEADTSKYYNDSELLNGRSVQYPASDAQISRMGIAYTSVRNGHSMFSVSGKDLHGSTREFNERDVQGSDYNRFSHYFCIVDLTPFRSSGRNVTKIEWRATGKPLGIYSDPECGFYHDNVEFVNFDSIDTSRIIALPNTFQGLSNSNLDWLNDKEFPELLDLTCTFYESGNNPTLKNALNAHNLITISGAFAKTDFGEKLPKHVYELDTLTVRRADWLFYQSSFEDTDNLYNWTMPDLLCSNGMFRENPTLKRTSGLKNLRMTKNVDFGMMFYGDSELEDIGVMLAKWGNNAGKADGLDNTNGVCGMFANCRKLSKVYGAGTFLSKVPNSGTYITYFLSGTGIKSALDLVGAITTKVRSITGFFMQCRDFSDWTGLETWITSNVDMARRTFYGTIWHQGTTITSLRHISGWNMNSVTIFTNLNLMIGAMFYESSSMTLGECQALADSVVSMLSGWNLPSSIYLAKRYFNRPSLGYQVVVRKNDGTTDFSQL